MIGKHCLIEFIDGLTKRVEKQVAVYELDKILDSKIVELEWETKEDWRKAVEYFKRYHDQKIDLTDSLSFAIMERRGINEVFTFDVDFKIHGFIMKPESI